MSDTAKSRLHGIAAALGMPVEAFLLPHPDAVPPKVFTSRDEEAAELLRLYFAIDDLATRTRYRELLRGLSSSIAEIASGQL